MYFLYLTKDMYKLYLWNILFYYVYNISMICFGNILLLYVFGKYVKYIFIKYFFDRATAIAVAAPIPNDREAKLHYITWHVQTPKVPKFPVNLYDDHKVYGFEILYTERPHSKEQNAFYRMSKFDLVPEIWTFQFSEIWLKCVAFRFRFCFCFCFCFFNTFHQNYIRFFEQTVHRRRFIFHTRLS